MTRITSDYTTMRDKNV